MGGTRPLQLVAVGPDHPAAVPVTAHVHPSHLHPATDRVPVDAQAIGQATWAVLVPAQSDPTAVGFLAVESQPTDQSQRHISGGPVRSLRRVEPLGGEPPRDPRGGPPAVAQLPQSLDRPRVVRVPVVPAGRARQGVRARARADPVQPHVHPLALSTAATTRSGSGRAIRWRSAGVAADAARTAGRSDANARMDANAVSLDSAGALRTNRSYPSSSRRWASRASSRRRSSSRATSRFSGSHAWCRRAARPTSNAARSRRRCHRRVTSARRRPTPATAARLAPSAAGSTAARNRRATNASRAPPLDGPRQTGSA
jgi:hypothetical protein